jgi:hypothetical protein
MAIWLGGFEGGLARGLPAADIEKFKDWLFDQPTMKGLQLVCLHNSGAPNIKQTDATPGGYDQRQRNIAPGYKKQGWRGGPAFNVYPDGTIRGGTPWGLYGVHSPSWNNIGIGIEMMADFRTGVDDDDAGKGLLMKNVACEMIAAILFHQGLPVSDATVKLHRFDKATSHVCPGNDVVFTDVMDRVRAYYDAMDEAGDHILNAEEEGKKPPTYSYYQSGVNDLNVRTSGSMAGRIITKIAKGQIVKVWSTASNGSTVWAHVSFSKDGKVYVDGHVSCAYLKPSAVAPLTPVPPTQIPSLPIPAPPVVVVPTPTDRPYWGARMLMVNGEWPAHWAAAGIGAAQVESYKDLRVKAAGDDPDGPGPLGPTAFTIWQLRDGRHANFKTFATARGKSEDDFETQAMWPTTEMPQSEHLAWSWLQKATTVEQAAAAFAFYERPSGYISANAKAATTWDEVMAVARKVSHWDWRLANAEALYKRLA